jgi:hypothetical protein
MGFLAALITFERVRSLDCGTSNQTVHMLLSSKLAGVVTSIIKL